MMACYIPGVRLPSSNVFRNGRNVTNALKSETVPDVLFLVFFPYDKVSIFWRF